MDDFVFDVPDCSDFNKVDEIDVDDGYFERRQESPIVGRYYTRLSSRKSCEMSQNGNAAPTNTTETAELMQIQSSAQNPRKTSENKKPTSSSRRLSAPKVRYQYQFRKTTVPKTPLLRSVARTRPIHLDTPGTREEKIVNEMKKLQFKATKLEKKVFDPPKLIKLGHKHTEAFEVPDLKTASRAKHWTQDHGASTESENEQQFTFKAQPLPDYGELGRIGVFSHQPLPVTHAKTPKFHPTHSSRLRNTVEKEEKKQLPMFYHPAPKFTSTFKVEKQKKVTKVEPFSFQTRSAASSRSEKHKLEDDENRGAVGHQKFKAKPAPKGSPFRPLQNLIPPTKVQESLIPKSVDHRMGDRKVFDSEFAARRAAEETAVNVRLERERQQRYKQLRSQTQFRANPVKSYRRLSVRLAHKSTTAHSPNFSTRLNCVDVRKRQQLRRDSTKLTKR